MISDQTSEGSTTPAPADPTHPATPPAAAGPPALPQWAYPPRRRSLGRRILSGFFVLAFVLSILLNLYFMAALAAQLEPGFSKVTVKEGAPDQTIAMYEIEGMIDGQAAQRFSAFCDDVKKDNRVKAVLLRVSSPGGTVSASDQIHHLVKQIQGEGKKVVVSMGGIAASGGYYVSASADEIIAESTTVTGSIGVIMAWPVISGTLGKLGIEPVVMKSSHALGWKDEGNWLRTPDPHHRQHLQQVLDAMQARFEDQVRAGRGKRLSPRTATVTVPGENVQAPPVTYTETEPFNGKIYLSQDAKDLGLVDRIGYLSDAMDRSADLAGLNKPKVVRYEFRRSLLGQLVSGRGSTALDWGVRSLDEFQTPRILLMWKAE